MGFKYIEHIARNGVPIKCKPADPDSGIICCTIDMYAHIYILYIYIYIILYIYNIYIHSHCLDMSGYVWIGICLPCTTSRAVHFNLRNNKCVCGPFQGMFTFFRAMAAIGVLRRGRAKACKDLVASFQPKVDCSLTSLPASTSVAEILPGQVAKVEEAVHLTIPDTKRVGNVWEACGKRVGNLQNSSFGMPRHRAARSSGSAHCLVQSSHPEM